MQKQHELAKEKKELKTLLDRFDYYSKEIHKDTKKTLTFKESWNLKDIKRYKEDVGFLVGAMAQFWG